MMIWIHQQGVQPPAPVRWHVRITCELHNIPGDEEDLAVLAVLIGDELKVVDGVAACIRWVAWTL
jgi:hypothetical protein